MKSLTKRYVLLWVVVLIVFNVVVLLIQYMVPSLDIYRGAVIESVKNLTISTANIPDDLRETATRGLLNFQSTVYGIVAFNVLMVIQLVFFIIISNNIKESDDMLLALPLLALSKKFLVFTVIMCLVFSLIRNIPTFISILITLVFVIYIFIQYNRYSLQKEYVEDLEKRNKERKNK